MGWGISKKSPIKKKLHIMPKTLKIPPSLSNRKEKAMPRIKQNKLEYMKTDFIKMISGEMKAKKIKQKRLAELLGISQPQMSIKLKECNLKYSEILIIFHEIGLSDSDILKALKY